MTSNTTAAANAGSPESMATPARALPYEVGQFYDAMWQPALSFGALAYGAAHIGQECLLTADEILALAQIAAISSSTYVLDLGSGTGGPACYLARHLGCRVLGLDVSSVGHRHALARASEHNVNHLVTFQHGDMQSLDLPAASVDVILSLDAWWHIPQRGALLQRCATWLRPGGRLAFYDQVERHPLPESARQALQTLWQVPDLVTPQRHITLIQAAGLQLDFEVETSFNAARFYTGLLEAYQTQRTTLERVRGPERYATELARLQMTQPLAAFGMLGQIGGIAIKPTDDSPPRQRGRQA